MLELALGLSLHIGLMNNYNYIHPHIRYTYDNVIGGAYYNSQDNISLYGGYRWEYDGIGFEGAIVTGYSQYPIVPYGRITYNNFFAAPAVEDNRIGGVIGYEIKF